LSGVALGQHVGGELDAVAAVFVLSDEKFAAPVRFISPAT